MSDPGTDPSTRSEAPLSMQVHSMSKADDLSFLGQKAVADAMADDGEYRIVGGTMVRLLGLVYPTPAARARTTVDADTAVGDIEIVGAVAERATAGDFAPAGGNLCFKPLDAARRMEVKLLPSRHGTASGMQPQGVPGGGQVDTLPELVFALA